MNPISSHHWQCSDDASPACGLLKSARDPYKPVEGAPRGFCSLSVDEYVWTHREYTVLAEYGLVCDKAYLSAVATSAFFVGFMLGSPVAGWLADKLGRKLAIHVGTTLQLVATVALAFSPNYSSHVVIRGLVGRAGRQGGVLSSLNFQIV